jgi:hypothetical protein
MKLKYTILRSSILQCQLRLLRYGKYADRECWEEYVDLSGTK